MRCEATFRSATSRRRAMRRLRAGSQSPDQRSLRQRATRSLQLHRVNHTRLISIEYPHQEALRALTGDFHVKTICMLKSVAQRADKQSKRRNRLETYIGKPLSRNPLALATVYKDGLGRLWQNQTEAA